jgi:hypothetical protein
MKVNRDMSFAQFAGMRRPGHCVAAAAAAMLCCTLASCASNVVDGVYRDPAKGATTGGPSGSAVTEGNQFTKDISSFFLGDTGPGKPVVAGSAEDIDCPSIDIRPGASTLTIPPSGDAGASVLRYQVTIAQMARTCRLVGGTVKMKVGVQGRIILGPAGGAGKLDIPLRYAVVHEGPEPKTIVTKFYKVPVMVPDAQQNVPFLHVDDDVEFPMPGIEQLDAYVVYVGFDSTGDKKPPPPKKPAPKPVPKPARAR